LLYEALKNQKGENRKRKGVRGRLNLPKGGTWGGTVFKGLFLGRDWSLLRGTLPETGPRKKETPQRYWLEEKGPRGRTN